MHEALARHDVFETAFVDDLAAGEGRVLAKQIDLEVEPADREVRLEDFWKGLRPAEYHRSRSAGSEHSGTASRGCAGNGARA